MNWCNENVCATIFFAKVSSDFFADKKLVTVIGPGKVETILVAIFRSLDDWGYM